MFKLKNIEVSPSFLLVFAFFCIFDKPSYIIIIFLSATLHELAHIFTVLLCKVQIKKIRILAFGAQIELVNHNTLSYKKEIFVALAGPFANLLFAMLTVFYQYSCGTNEYCQLFALCNVLLFLMNSLPIMPLDGGRALYALLLNSTNIVRAAFISDFISVLFTVPLLLLGFYILTITGYNFSLILISGYLLIIFLSKKLFLKS